jgi:acyl carrier protein
MKNSEKVILMLARQLNKKPEIVTADKRIKEDLGADSLDIVDLIMNIEDAFGITVPDEAAETIKTVGELASYVESFEN